MVRKVQRNEPCLCGSGKKYKKCCMIKERDHVVASVSRREGVQHALAWVSHHYSQQIEHWVEEVWLADISDEQRQGIANADPKIRSIHDVNLLEKLLAEGRFAGMDGEDRPLQLILDSDELALNQEQRDYLVQLPSCRLHLYTVAACAPGESFSVRNLLGGDGGEMTIADAYGSRMFDVGDTVGLRMLQTPSGWETSGAIYHIPDPYVVELKAQLATPEVDYSATLIHYWLELVAKHV